MAYKANTMEQTMTTKKTDTSSERDGVPTPVEDPALVAAKEAAAAKVAWKALPDRTPEDEETPEYQAAEKLWFKTEHAFADAPVASMAGALVKLRALRKELVEAEAAAYVKGHVETVLAFLEGFSGVAQADSVVTLFAEWGAFQDEADAIDSKNDKLWNVALDRRDVVGDKIMETLATSMKGVAIKIRLASHYAFEVANLAPLYDTPSRDIDYAELEGGAGGALNDHLVSALRDAERLAGAP